MKVACALIVQKQKVMIAQRPLHKSHGGLWEFPGGKVESGETTKESLCRELMEELRIEVSPRELEPLGEVSVKKINLHSFVMNYEGPILPQEHIALAWVSIEKIMNYPLCESDLKTLSQFSKALKLN